MDKKIGLVYRSKKNQRFSIETLFSPFDNDSFIEKIVLPCNLTSLKNLVKIIFFSFTIKPKVIHITGDVHYLAFILFWKKSIITIHDLNHYENLKGLRRFFYGFIWFYLPLKFAKKIVTISPYTKDQLLTHFKLNENKITVIPNSFLKFHDHEELLLNKNQDRFRILCIGSGANKNFDRLIDALDGIENIEIRLVGKQSVSIENKLKAKKIEYSIVYNIDRTDLQKEYKLADLLYFASTKEGFGLPILEAQSLGIPVLTSTTTAMPFVGGNGAVYVDPYSVNSIRESLLLFVNKKIDIESLKESGFKNIERFSILNFKEAYKKIYSSI
jgi:glycosyltransferase involved in cell wall biosynthesis